MGTRHSNISCSGGFLQAPTLVPALEAGGLPLMQPALGKSPDPPQIHGLNCRGVEHSGDSGVQIAS